MNRVIVGALAALTISCLAQAQSSDHAKGQGYVYIAPGGNITAGAGSVATLQFGLGAEAFFNRHLGVGVDGGFAGDLAPDEKFSSGWGTLSSNFVARFTRKDEKKKIEPFLTAGYTHVLRSGYNGSNGFNVGFGINWWTEKRAALRIEVRDHIYDLAYGGAYHLLGLRIGLTFR